MAREAYRSLYGDLTKLKDDSLLKDQAGGTGDDDELFQLLLAVLIAITSLKADEDEDLTFEVTWATTDYFTEPHNVDPTAHWGSPWTSLLARKAGEKQSFLAGEQKWGYSEVAELSGSLLNEDMDTSETAMDVDDGTHFAIGQTVLVNSEQMLVTGISTNTLTVVRGINGTTAATADNNDPVSIIRWPAPIERAALIQAARIWTRAADFEPFFVDADMDTDVRLMLESYRHRASACCDRCFSRPTPREVG